MALFQGMNSTASALTAQRLRMDVISSNMANVDTARGKYVDGKWQPYQRKMVVLQPGNAPFSSYLNKAMGSQSGVGEGVKVAKVVEDDSPAKLVYDPTNADADENGYVSMPNVDPLREMVDLMSATRSYEANVTVFNASKSMMMKALEIGK
ncbi:flagellar basal body rod protein FlgC [Bacillus sp. 1P06AnD]|uniref:flagellar basal body rod protein FlgC n=1 Tax=Bacillus sp. 1P06AnD TaxID=3132208 RepID=UPI0039A30397